MPLFVTSLPIFSRAYYGGRTFDETTLDVPDAGARLRLRALDLAGQLGPEATAVIGR